ncbi:heme-degrading monooxygenase HmoA [Cytobacillus horneckiae]|uniref:hypothetical protein n=1 Tax=Cytobacillus horneckiae TaxID=549687 RepID=UPI0019CF8A8E|nr:hypothetical protein [Cytobacillus horneckiae]MBN6887003.1 hypothetical protein [Cytobacillus horneckiae]
MRRLTTHHRRDREEGLMVVVTIWEEEVSKEQVKKASPFSKKHDVLIKDGDLYDFKRKRA